MFRTSTLTPHSKTCAVALQGLLWETSLLDPEDGIRFRGHSIPQLQVLPCSHQSQVMCS